MAGQESNRVADINKQASFQVSRLDGSRAIAWIGNQAVTLHGNLKIKANGYAIDVLMAEVILDKDSMSYHSPSHRSQNQREYGMNSTQDVVVQKTDLAFQTNTVCWLD